MTTPTDRITDGAASLTGSTNVDSLSPIPGRGSRTARRVAGICIAVICFGFMATQAAKQIDACRTLSWQFGWQTMLAAPSIMVAQCMIAGIVYLCLRSLGAAPAWRDVTRIHLISQGAKYLPGGGFFNIASQTVSLGQLSGVGAIRAGTAVFFMIATVCASALTWYGLAGICRDNGSTALNVVALALLPLWLVSLYSPRVRRIVLTRFTRARSGDLPPDATPIVASTHLLSHGFLGLASFGLYGLSIVVIVMGHVPMSVQLCIQLIGAMALSWLAGFLSVVVPAGLGVRDVSLMVLLKPLLPPPWPIIVPVLSRLLWLVADVANIGLAALMFRKSVVNNISQQKGLRLERPPR